MGYPRAPQGGPDRVSMAHRADPELLFVPAPRVQAVANETGAAPYDVPDVELTHIGEFCSFDAFLKRYELADPALARLAVIVRGADTGRLDITPEAAGLLAVSIGLSATFADDHDALYAWCESGQGEIHVAAGRSRELGRRRLEGPEADDDYRRECHRDETDVWRVTTGNRGFRAVAGLD